MELLQRFSNIVNELKGTNSSVEKVNILKKYKEDREVCQLFMYIYNTFFKYGITSANLIKNEELSDLQFYTLIEILDLLRTRKLTGNKAIATVNGYINQNYNFKELLYDIFDKNLKIGMNIKQINKALNNIIPTFDVALACIYQESKREKYDLEKYNIQRKMNGVRLVVIITYNKEKNIGEIKSYSRTGKEFTTCKKIEEQLIGYYNKSKYFGQDIVFDGECCLVDGEGKQDWNGIVSQIKRKNFIMERPKYTIFDFLTLDEFSGIKESHDYNWRRDKMLRLFFGFNGTQQFKYLDMIFSTPYTQDHFKKMMERYVINNKWQGLIFRKNCNYKSGRSTDLLKVKLFNDEQFTIFDIEISEKPMLNKEGKMVMTKCVGSLLFKLDNGNICKVGSGINDQQRIDWYIDPTKIIGKTVTIKYKEKTKNADGTYSLQFPVLMCVYEDKRDI